MIFISDLHHWPFWPGSKSGITPSWRVHQIASVPFELRSEFLDLLKHLAQKNSVTCKSIFFHFYSNLPNSIPILKISKASLSLLSVSFEPSLIHWPSLSRFQDLQMKLNGRLGRSNSFSSLMASEENIILICDSWNYAGTCLKIFAYTCGSFFCFLKVLKLQRSRDRIKMGWITPAKAWFHMVNQNAGSIDMTKFLGRWRFAAPFGRPVYLAARASWLLLTHLACVCSYLPSSRRKNYLKKKKKLHKFKAPIRSDPASPPTTLRPFAAHRSLTPRSPRVASRLWHLRLAVWACKRWRAAENLSDD